MVWFMASSRKTHWWTISVFPCVHHLTLRSPTQNQWRAIMDHVAAAEDALSSHLLLIEGQRCDCALRTLSRPCSRTQEDILLALVVFFCAALSLNISGRQR